MLRAKDQLKLHSLIEEMNHALESVRLHHFQHLGEVTNLKMHDAFSYWYSLDNVPVDWFYQWCEDNYEFGYSEELNLHRLEVVYPTRSASHFYFKPTDSNIYYLYNFSDYKDLSPEECREQIFGEFLYYHANFQFNYHGDLENGKVKNIQEIEQLMEEYHCSFEEAVEDLGLSSLLERGMDILFKEFCEEQLTDINAMYQYIEKFKKHQVDYFKDYIEYRLAEEEEQAY